MAPRKAEKAKKKAPSVFSKVRNNTKSKVTKNTTNQIKPVKLGANIYFAQSRHTANYVPGLKPKPVPAPQWPTLISKNRKQTNSMSIKHQPYKQHLT